MAKLVCHVEKYKKGNVASLERHNERKNSHYSNDEIDVAKAHLNYDLIQRTEQSYYRSVMKLVDARENPSGKNLRKDAVVLCEIIISSGSEFFEKCSEQEQRRFFEESCKYLQGVFGKEHCIYAVVHNDEHTPHMHFGFVPLTEQNKLCAKEVVDGSNLIRLQAEMPKYLQENGFLIERGDLASVSVHKSVKQYKADMEKEKVNLAASIQKQKQELQKIAATKTDIQSVEEISTGKTIFGDKVTVDEADYKKVTSLAKKQLATEKKEKKLSKEISDLRKENKELKTSNDDLKSQLKQEKSLSKHLAVSGMEVELRELRKFKEMAEKFLTEHGLMDYFKKLFIHSNNREL